MIGEIGDGDGRSMYSAVCRLVEDDVYTFHGCTHGGGVGDRTFDELDLGIQVFRETTREIVEDADGITAVDKAVDDVRPDEPSASSDKRAHGWAP